MSSYGMALATPEADDSTLHLPRLLCLHGGGTNARIFRAQCRALEKALKPTFRFCYAEAPFPSQPGPDVTSVYAEFGPFKAWLRWRPEDPERGVETAVEEIEAALKGAIAADDEKGATGEWVGLLGFSQGAKMSASLLYSQQIHTKKFKGHSPIGPKFRFAVLLAGQGPLVSLVPELVMTPGLVEVACISGPSWNGEHGLTTMRQLLCLPTIHVHGMRDPGLELHRKLLSQYCDNRHTRLIEWDGNHRVPIKTNDVAAVVSEILSVARETGVFMTLLQSFKETQTPTVQVTALTESAHDTVMLEPSIGKG
jgi:predicted esterase